jgi:hypothetical protein
MTTVLHAIETKDEMYLRKPGGRKSRRKGLVTWSQQARRTWPRGHLKRQGSLPQRFRERKRPSRLQRELKWKRQWHPSREKPPWKESLTRAARSKHQEEPWGVHGG